MQGGASSVRSREHTAPVIALDEATSPTWAHPAHPFPLQEPTSEGGHPPLPRKTVGRGLGCVSGARVYDSGGLMGGQGCTRRGPPQRSASSFCSGGGGGGTGSPLYPSTQPPTIRLCDRSPGASRAAQRFPPQPPSQNGEWVWEGKQFQGLILEGRIPCPPQVGLGKEGAHL